MDAIMRLAFISPHYHFITVKMDSVIMVFYGYSERLHWFVFVCYGCLHLKSLC